ncbi:MAG: hypothetical protein K2F63_00135, partial [Muribaculaceae bacterium]|nr:hypothetical protein [Muribaculaceae bacterium]
GLSALRQPMIGRGAEILEKWLEDNRIPDNNRVITKLLGIFHVSNRDELCYQLGADEIVPGDYLVKPLRRAAEGSTDRGSMFSKFLTVAKKATFLGTKSSRQNGSSSDESAEINPRQIYSLSTNDKGEANFRLAPCCSPIPGDDVLGFLTDDGAVEIHSLDCPNAQVLKAAYGSRIVATEWAGIASHFTARVRIEGIDRRGILQEITYLISTHLGMDLRKLNIEASGEIFKCDLWVLVGATDVVDDLCRHSLQINGVKSATRIH